MNEARIIRRYVSAMSSSLRNTPLAITVCIASAIMASSAVILAIIMTEMTGGSWRSSRTDGLHYIPMIIHAGCKIALVLGIAIVAAARDAREKINEDEPTGRSGHWRGWSLFLDRHMTLLTWHAVLVVPGLSLLWIAAMVGAVLLRDNIRPDAPSDVLLWHILIWMTSNVVMLCVACELIATVLLIRSVRERDLPVALATRDAHGDRSRSRDDRECAALCRVLLKYELRIFIIYVLLMLVGVSLL